MGVNKAILIGNLGKDPEVRTTTNGTQVASFSLATSETYNDKNGQRQERTEWHNIVAWTKLAEFAGKYLKKGKCVYVEGRIQTSSYGEENNKKYKTEIVAETIRFVGSASDSDRSGGGSYSAPSGESDFGGAPSSGGSAPVVEDDLPF